MGAFSKGCANESLVSNGLLAAAMLIEVHHNATAPLSRLLTLPIFAFLYRDEIRIAGGLEASTA